MTRGLLITRLFPLSKSPGLGIFLERQIRALRPFEVEFDVLVVRPRAPWPLYYLPSWRQYAPDNRPLPRADSKLAFARYLRPAGRWFAALEGRAIYASLRSAASQWQRERPYDLILSGSMYPEVEAAAELAERFGLPLAALAIGSDVRVYAPASPGAERRLAQVLERVELPLAASRELAQRLRQIAPGAAEPRVVYLARDERAFSPLADRNPLRAELGLEKDAIVGCYVGALWESKGIPELASALPDLLRRHPKFQLIALGEGAEGAALAAAARAAGRPAAVRLTGPLPPAQVPRFLNAGDFFVFPSRSEGMPQAVLEAMSCGLPVVATRVGGIPEAVLDGETGILVAPRDSSALRAAIERMIQDRDFRRAAGQASRSRVLEHFDTETHTRALAQALRDLANPGARR